jgi:hypothetical protein
VAAYGEIPMAAVSFTSSRRWALLLVVVNLQRVLPWRLLIGSSDAMPSASMALSAMNPGGEHVAVRRAVLASRM